ncbi:endonuclease domain-containing protein [Micromonospora sp. ANENR4]|uniref:endonuclease domain-containing protein n=1 Tax=Micromonospora sp. ANENR4 TaxID=2783662 RepID=UPI00351C2A55
MKLPCLRAYAAARSRWPGAPLLREVLALAEPLSESPMETRLRLLLLDAGLGPLVAQHEVRAGGRFVARVDLAWPALRLAVEYDGDHHRERAHFRRDVARLNALRAAGWVVLRFTADDVLRRPDATVALVRQALAERLATAANHDPRPQLRPTPARHPPPGRAGRHGRRKAARRHLWRSTRD